MSNSTQVVLTAAHVTAGKSPAAERLRLQVQRMAPHFRTILLTGEPGSGKAAIAQELHRLSPVADQEFISQTIPELISSSHTPARGVLFLQHLDQLAPADQPLLLARLNRLHRDMRLIIGCGCDPRGLAASGKLGPELYSRLGTLEIRIPALRERLEDLPALLASLSSRHLLEDGLERLLQHKWPGNLHELLDFCTHANQSGAPDWSRLTPANAPKPDTLRLAEVIDRHVVDVLQRCAGNKLRAAELLGISRSTLYRMLDSPGV